MEKKRSLLLLFVWAGLALADFPGPGGFERKNECSDDSDCPKYNYCFHSYWLGSSCESFMDDNAGRPSQNCAGRGPRRNLWPDHAACRRLELEDNSWVGEERFSTSRCYPEVGYKCRKSYYMPCTRNHDSRGTLIRGEEESCPENFSCVSKEFKTGSAKVCVPDPPAEYFAQECETPFDCGYSQLESAWSACYEGHCARVVE